MNRFINIENNPKMPPQQTQLVQFKSTLCPWKIKALCSVPIFSHCRTHTRTQAPLISPGKISTVSAKNGVEQMASEWLKPPTMVPTTFPSFSLPLPRLLTTSLSSPPCACPATPIVWMHHPRLFNAIQACSSCQEAQAHWKPHGATQSQPRGERGIQGEKERWREVETWCFFFFLPPLLNDMKSYSHFSCAIFSPSHIYMKLSSVSAKRFFGSPLKCKIPKQLKHVCTSSHPLLPELFSLSSLCSSPPSSVPHLTSSHFSSTRPASWSASHVNEIVSRSEGMERNF